MEPHAHGGEGLHRCADALRVICGECPQVSVGRPDTHVGQAGSETPSAACFSVKILERAANERNVDDEVVHGKTFRVWWLVIGKSDMDLNVVMLLKPFDFLGGLAV